MKRTLVGRVSAILVVSALAAHAWSQAAPAIAPSGADAQALRSIGAANQMTAESLALGTCASERSAVSAAAVHCKDSTCVVALAAISALTPCAAVTMLARQPPAVQAAAVQSVVKVDKPWYAYLWEGFVGTVQAFTPLAQIAANAYTGKAQAAAARDTTLGIVSGMAGLGTNAINAATASNVAIADSGFRNGARSMADAWAANTANVNSLAQVAAKPGTVIHVTGNCNGVNTGSGSASPGCNTTTTTETTTTTTDNSDRSNRTGAP